MTKCTRKTRKTRKTWKTRKTRKTRKVKGGQTIITNDNIRDLVRSHCFAGEDELPDDLAETPIGQWDVSRVTDMSFLFNEAQEFDEDIGDWDVSHVTTMMGMFSGAESFNQPIGNWDVSNVTTMSNMFSGAKSFNQPIDQWDVSNVTDMSNMFAGAESFNQPIDQWDVSNVVEVEHTFEGASAFNQNLTTWTLRAAYDEDTMIGMFRDSAMDPANYPTDDPVPAPVRPVPAPARPVPAPARPVPALFNIVTGSLQKNDDYNPVALPRTHFPVSENKLSHEPEYVDLIEGDTKNVLDSLLADPLKIAFKRHNEFYAVISKEDFLKVMNDPNNIKYECPIVDSMRNIVRSVPYLSINSFAGQGGGVVSFFDLWNATKSPHRAYELVRTDRVVPSTVSHNILYNHGDRTAASHCQAGQDANVYELRILPIDPRIKAATKIQSVARGRRTRSKRAAREQAIRQNRNAFNAAFPPLRSRTRSNPSAKSRTRSKRYSADSR